MTKFWTSTLFPTDDHSQDRTYLPICWCSTEKQFFFKSMAKNDCSQGVLSYTSNFEMQWCSRLHGYTGSAVGHLGQSLQAWHRSWSRRRPRRGPQSGYRGCRSVWWSSPSVCWGRSTQSSPHTRLLRENGVEKRSTVNSLERQNLITFLQAFIVLRGWSSVVCWG